MKKIMAGLMGFLMIGMIAVEADAASRSSSSSRSVSSSRSSSFSAPKSYSAPKQQAAPKAAGTSSNPGLKALGFGKPASAQTAPRPSASGSPKTPSLNLSKPQPVVKTTSTQGGWFSKKSVSSAPAYKAPARKVSSPSAYKSKPRNVTVIQRNYYGGNSYGYNRGYGGGYYGNGYGYNSGGSGFGSSLMGAMAGMMLYDALTDNSAEKALQAQVNALTANQQATNNALLMMNQAPSAKPQAVPQPKCYLPEDAPLMMLPSFYCEQPK